MKTQTMNEFLYRRHLSDGRLIDVYPLTYNRARIGVGPQGSISYDNVW